MKPRISPTLLDSFQYYINLEDDERSAISRSELLARLKGEKLPPSPAMQKGIDFENDVVASTLGKYEDSGNEIYDSCVFEIAKITVGSIFQHHVEAEIGPVIVHGYIDALKANRIYDIKTTKKYEVGKYMHSNQHLTYLYCLQPRRIEHFEFLVTDFKRVYREYYHWENRFGSNLRANIAEFFAYLAVDKEMKQAWDEKQERDQSKRL